MLRDVLRRGLELLRIIPRTEVSAEVRGDRPAGKDLQADRLIVVRGRVDKWALMRCPCGCGDRLQLSLSPDRRPRWNVVVDRLGRPTVTPSVRMRDGCGAHFHLRGGCVEWCADSGQGSRFNNREL